MNRMQGMNAQGPNHFMPGSMQIQCPVCDVTCRFSLTAESRVNWRDPTHVVFYRGATFEFLAGRYAWRCERSSPNGVLMHEAPA